MLNIFFIAYILLLLLNYFLLFNVYLIKITENNNNHRHLSYYSFYFILCYVIGLSWGEQNASPYVHFVKFLPCMYTPTVMKLCAGWQYWYTFNPFSRRFRFYIFIIEFRMSLSYHNSGNMLSAYWLATCYLFKWSVTI